MHNKVKRAAVAEVQKAMALAEKRALDSVSGERIKMERILMEANNNNNNSNNISNSRKYNNDNINVNDHSTSQDLSAKDQVMITKNIKTLQSLSVKFDYNKILKNCKGKLSKLED